MVDWILDFYKPHYSTSCRDGVFLLRHPRHSSPTLFTAHASRTHVKTSQTDLHAKPDNSSGPTHDSPSERPFRKKETFQHKKHRKSMEDSSETATQAKHRPTLLHALFRSRIETKARRATPRPRHHPPRCPEPWKKPRKHQVRSHGSTPQHRSHRGPAQNSLGSKPLGWDWLASRTRCGSPRGPY